MSRVRLAGRHRQQVLAALTAAAMLVLVAVIIAVLAGRGGTVAAAPARAAGPAGAASSPAALPVAYSRVAGWHGGQVRPAAIYVGEGGAPYVSALRWPSWTVAGAQADGDLHVQKPGCALPTYQCPYQRFRVKIQLSQVETHDGVRYYSRMRWTYTMSQVRHVTRWTISGGFWRTSQYRPGNAA